MHSPRDVYTNASFVQPSTELINLFEQTEGCYYSETCTHSCAVAKQHARALVHGCPRVILDWWGDVLDFSLFAWSSCKMLTGNTPLSLTTVRVILLAEYVSEEKDGSKRRLSDPWGCAEDQDRTCREYVHEKRTLQQVYRKCNIWQAYRRNLVIRQQSLTEP